MLTHFAEKIQQKWRIHMAEEKKEVWLNYLAMATVLFAVAATLSTFRGQSYSTRSVLNEIKASNQWSYFQAKKIRGYMFEMQKELLETDLKVKSAKASPEEQVELQKIIDAFAKKIQKWDADRDEIELKARTYEKNRDEFIMHAQAFGYAVIFLQMAILLSSIAALMKKKAIWAAGLLVGVAGLVAFANGFLLFL
jgi:hypothetical protein